MISTTFHLQHVDCGALRRCASPDVSSRFIAKLPGVTLSFRASGYIGRRVIADGIKFFMWFRSDLHKGADND